MIRKNRLHFIPFFVILFMLICMIPCFADTHVAEFNIQAAKKKTSPYCTIVVKNIYDNADQIIDADGTEILIDLDDIQHKDDGSLIKKLINSQFLVKYYAFKENRPETTKISYFFKEIALIYSIIVQRKNLQIPLKEFISSTRKQIKKIKKNEYLYEGEDWEKVVASYIEKQNKDFYIDKGK